MEHQIESCSVDERVEQLKTARLGIVHQLRDAEEVVANLRTQITMLDGALREYDFQLQQVSSENPEGITRLPSRAERRRSRPKR